MFLGDLQVLPSFSQMLLAALSSSDFAPEPTYWKLFSCLKLQVSHAAPKNCQRVACVTKKASQTKKSLFPCHGCPDVK